MNKLFLAMDGDDAGGQIGQAVLRDDASALHEISSKIDAGSQVIKDWAAANGATVISIGGDEANLMLDPSKREAIQELKERYEQAAGVTVTIGTGLSLSQAGKSLMAGKLSGKNMIMNYDDHVEQVLNQAHSNSGQEGEDPEEKKINEHYLDQTMGGEQDLDQEAQPQIEDEGQEGLSLQGEQLGDIDQDESCDCPICSGEQEPLEPDSQSESPGLDIQGSPTSGEDSIDDDFSLEIPENNSLKQQSEDGLENMDASSEDVPESPEDDIQSDVAGEANEAEDGMDDMSPPSPDMGQEGQSDQGEQESVWAQQSPSSNIEQDDPDQAGLPPNASPDMAAPASPDMAAPASPDMAAPASPDMGQESEGQSGNELDLLSGLLADSQSQGDIKQKISMILEKFKANRDLIVSMKQSNPDLYVGIIGLLKQTIDMAKQAGIQSPQASSPDMAQVGGQSSIPKM